MKKFSKLNESQTQEILGWSPNEILKELSTIPNCKVTYKRTQFIFRDEGHEIASLEDIQRGEIKTDYFQHTLEPDYEYHPQHSFILDFGKFISFKIAVAYSTPLSSCLLGSHIYPISCSQAANLMSRMVLFSIFSFFAIASALHTTSLMWSIV